MSPSPAGVFSTESLMLPVARLELTVCAGKKGGGTVDRWQGWRATPDPLYALVSYPGRETRTSGDRIGLEPHLGIWGWHHYSVRRAYHSAGSTGTSAAYTPAYQHVGNKSRTPPGFMATPQLTPEQASPNGASPAAKIPRGYMGSCKGPVLPGPCFPDLPSRLHARSVALAPSLSDIQ